MVALGGALTVVRASATFLEVTETGSPGMLSIARSSETPLWGTLAPGDTMHWLVEARLTDADSGTLSLEFRADGALVDSFGMSASVSACSQDFTFASAGSSQVPMCAGTTLPVVPPTPLVAIATASSGVLFPLAELQAAQPRQLLVTLHLPPSAASADVAGQDARVGLALHSSGQSPPAVDAPAPLAATGSDALALSALALGLLGIGWGVLLRRAARAGSGVGGDA
ncbi:MULTISPECIES: hypothetical protein [unclassified Leucobacter]|uniref:hypothetical protein n=1 Tax=unclassified Leucobacter TaxID=2621730 RepID=UPI00165D77F7|nr:MULTISPECIES: hypothetical protein [unclassified Leucobacter]MBC9936487.1 hypothetical protein [Leucobacter sp. cx-87]